MWQSHVLIKLDAKPLVDNLSRVIMSVSFIMWSSETLYCSCFIKQAVRDGARQVPTVEHYLSSLKV